MKKLELNAKNSIVEVFDKFSIVAIELFDSFTSIDKVVRTP